MINDRMKNEPQTSKPDAGREMLKRRTCQTADPNTPDAHCRPSVPQYMVILDFVRPSIYGNLICMIILGVGLRFGV